jgi:4-oxalocrotonate tautomerase
MRERIARKVSKSFGARARAAVRADNNQSSSTTEKHMPLVNVKMIEGVFTPNQKKEMIRKLTDTMVSIEGENLRSATIVVLEEVKSGDWAFGGKSLTTADVKALASGLQPVHS